MGLPFPGFSGFPGFFFLQLRPDVPVKGSEGYDYYCSMAYDVDDACFYTLPPEDLQDGEWVERGALWPLRSNTVVSGERERL